MALLFPFEETLDAIRSIAELAGDFTAPESLSVLDDFARWLESFRVARPKGRKVWEIPQNAALCTVISEGEYEAGERRGRHHAFAELTCRWEVEHHPSIETLKKSRLPNIFVLAGLASTQIRLLDYDPEAPARELAVWRTEIADHASPGCHFHVQVLGRRQDAIFPHSLSVPRLPTFFSTPWAAFEFVLAELFQSRWPRATVRQTPALQRWSMLQRSPIPELEPRRDRKRTRVTLVGTKVGEAAR